MIAAEIGIPEEALSFMRNAAAEIAAGLAQPHVEDLLLFVFSEAWREGYREGSASSAGKDNAK